MQTATSSEKPEEAEQTFLVEWDGENDPFDPRTFATTRKWAYVAVVAIGSLLVYVIRLMLITDGIADFAKHLYLFIVHYDLRPVASRVWVLARDLQPWPVHVLGRHGLWTSYI